MAIDRSELRLVWPPALFAGEARALLATDAGDDALGGLLAEAFHGDRAEQLLWQVARANPPRPPDHLAPGPGRTMIEVWEGGDHIGPRATVQLVSGLVDDAEILPRYHPRPLFRQRQQPTVPSVLSAAETKDEFARLVLELSGLGYFEDAFGSHCPDSCDDPDSQGQRILAERLKVDLALWPLYARSNVFTGTIKVHEDWPDDVFFDVIEALDEMVARPRQRSWHSFHEGWDYDDYVRSAGQSVYRWKVNEVLARTNLGLRLAESGTDAGILVRATDDARAELVERALLTPNAEDGGDLEHAVRMFRGRTASREDKRSAIVSLARVLEHRRDLLKDKLTRKDEGALFHIANAFDLRHRNDQQQADYGEEFLDWIFWWYLGTVELSNQLLRRDGSTT